MKNEYKLSELGRKIVEALPDRAEVKRIILAHKLAERKMKGKEKK